MRTTSLTVSFHFSIDFRIVYSVKLSVLRDTNLCCSLLHELSIQFNLNWFIFFHFQLIASRDYWAKCLDMGNCRLFKKNLITFNWLFNWWNVLSLWLKHTESLLVHCLWRCHKSWKSYQTKVALALTFFPYFWNSLQSHSIYRTVLLKVCFKRVVQQFEQWILLNANDFFQDFHLVHGEMFHFWLFKPLLSLLWCCTSMANYSRLWCSWWPTSLPHTRSWEDSHQSTCYGHYKYDLTNDFNAIWSNRLFYFHFSMHLLINFDTF